MELKQSNQQIEITFHNTLELEKFINDLLFGESFVEEFN